MQYKGRRIPGRTPKLIMKTALLIPIMFVLATSQQPAVVDSRPVILAFGDSLTAGYGVPPTLGYPEQLQKRLDAGGYQYRVVNMGLTGDTTSGGRARMTRALTANPTIVILELGGNDSGNGLAPSQTQNNLEQMITAFQRSRITVVLAGRVVAGRQDIFGNLAAQHRLTLIPDFLNGVFGNPELTIGDRVHPNADGYAIVATTVMKAIEPLLKR